MKLNVKSVVFFFIVLATSRNTYTQNIISNPGFELNTRLPSNLGEWHLLVDWTNGNSNSAALFSPTPDYYHHGGSFMAQLPNSPFGVIQAHGDSAIAGCLFWHPNYRIPSTREYMTGKFTTPLEIGQEYNFSFFISNTPSGGPPMVGGATTFHYGYGIDKIQIHFSKTAVIQTGGGVANVTPHFSLDTILFTTTWKKISFDFIADSAYDFFTIGNFVNDSNVSSVFFMGDTAQKVAYYFFDDFHMESNLMIIGDSALCLGDTVVLSARGDTAFAWADSLNPGVILSTDTFLRVGPTSTTTYFLYGTDDTLSYTLNVVTPFTVDLGNDTILCLNDTLILTPGLPSMINPSYLWSDSSTGSTLNVNQDGTYWITVRDIACEASDTIEVLSVPNLDVDLGNDSLLCLGTSIYLDVDQTNATYLWHDGSTNSYFEVIAAGQYWIEVQNGCETKTDTVTYGVLFPPNVYLGEDTTLCKRSSITLDAYDSTATSYLWQDGSNLSYYVVSESDEYRVKVVNACDFDMDSISVLFRLPPNFNLGNDTVLCSEQQLVLDVYHEGATYLWQDNSTSSQILVTESGLYQVNVKNPCGELTDQIEVKTTFCEGHFFVPNSFTPGDDGLNDVFQPKGSFLELETFKMEIYNRWGTRVYQSHDYGQGWDGTFEGQLVPTGSYIYIINYKDPNGNDIQLNGVISLIR